MLSVVLTDALPPPERQAMTEGALYTDSFWSGTEGKELKSRLGRSGGAAWGVGTLIATGLFILGAILQLVSSLVSSILPSITIMGGYANASTILGMLGGGLFLGSFIFLGWLFLGLYFGAQTDGAAQTASTYSDPISHDI